MKLAISTGNCNVNCAKRGEHVLLFPVDRDTHEFYSLPCFFVCHRTVSMAAVYQLQIKYDQDKFGAVFLDAQSAITFSFEDKHVADEHHVIRKSHINHTGKNVLDWFETNSRLKKRYSEGGKEIRGCRGATGKSSNLRHARETDNLFKARWNVNFESRLVQVWILIWKAIGMITSSDYNNQNIVGFLIFLSPIWTIKLVGILKLLLKITDKWL